MKCMRCGKESKWELCRECKEVKHRAGALTVFNCLLYGYIIGECITSLL